MKVVLRLLLRNYSSHSYVYKARVPYPPPLHHFYSTSTDKKSATNPSIFDFNPAEAATVRSRLRNPEKSNALLSFLKENEFSNAHLQKIIKSFPSFFSIDLEKSMKPKIRIFRELGFSNNDIANLFACNASIVYRSTDNRLIPAISLLRRVLGSDSNVVKLLMKCGWFVTKDLEKCMVPNIEFLKSRRVAMEQIIRCMHSFPRFMLQKPQNVRKQAEKAEAMGAQPGTKLYIHAVRIVGSHSDEAWELKLQAFRNLGFSEDDILNAFKKYAPAFGVSVRKLGEVKELLVSSGKYDVGSILNYPLSFAFSIEKRFKPRIQVLAALEHKGLINKWPSLSSLSMKTDKDFFEVFVAPYVDEVGHLFVANTATLPKQSS